MKIIFLKDLSLTDGKFNYNYKIDEVRDLSESRAQELISQGYASSVEWWNEPLMISYFKVLSDCTTLLTNQESRA